MSELAAEAAVRRAGPGDAHEVARLLHDFNTEFDTATPGPVVLTARLESLLAGPGTVAYLTGEPAVGVALITLRSNVWYDGPVALLDELYVAPAHRGRGLGTAIILRLFQDAVDFGVSAIEINVDEEDVDAQRFYERHGFAGTDPETGDRAFYYLREL
ncbi:GNAT family N-acetyltransferase [Microbacterium sulfonylureivorans]|uniref:GNAT family N-acetyltransferase n=1 Tax=Microbacterium sulfonylureivorans TaxID=2486854 RepID=UPI000FD6ED6C|nr:GNAT family N-acetyltransferase [Microbacterium sulfonylureivorans]